MAAFETPVPLGFAVGDPVPSAFMNWLNTSLPKAPNFVDGDAEYNPAALIQIGGAGFQWNGPTAFADTSVTTWEDGSACVWEDGSTCTWENGSLVTFGDGCLVTVELDCTIELFGGISVRSGGGTISFASGGVLNFQAGSTITGSASVASGATVTVASGGTLAAASGSTVNFAGTTTFTSSTNPQLSPARTWTRHSLRICYGNHIRDLNTGVVTSYTAWEVASSGHGPSVQTISSSSARTMLELDDLPHGQTISQVVLRTVFDSDPGSITDEASYKIVRWNDEDAYEDMSAAVDDSHTAGGWSTVSAQTIAVNAHATIDRAYRYAVEVTHHNVTNASKMVTYSAVASGTYSSLVV